MFAGFSISFKKPLLGSISTRPCESAEESQFGVIVDVDEENYVLVLLCDILEAATDPRHDGRLVVHA